MFPPRHPRWERTEGSKNNVLTATILFGIPNRSPNHEYCSGKRTRCRQKGGSRKGKKFVAISSRKQHGQGLGRVSFTSVFAFPRRKLRGAMKPSIPSFLRPSVSCVHLADLPFPRRCEARLISFCFDEMGSHMTAWSL